MLFMKPWKVAGSDTRSTSFGTCVKTEAFQHYVNHVIILTTHDHVVGFNSVIYSLTHSFTIHSCMHVMHACIDSVQLSFSASVIPLVLAHKQFSIYIYIYTLALSFCHFLFSKLPPRRVPGIIWYTWYYKAWKKNNENHGNIDETYGKIIKKNQWTPWKKSINTMETWMKTMDTLDETHGNIRWKPCKHSMKTGKSMNIMEQTMKNTKKTISAME